MNRNKITIFTVYLLTFKSYFLISPFIHSFIHSLYACADYEKALTAMQNHIAIAYDNWTSGMAPARCRLTQGKYISGISVMPSVVKCFPSRTAIPTDEDSSPDSREFLNVTCAFIFSGVVPRMQSPKKGT